MSDHIQVEPGTSRYGGFLIMEVIKYYYGTVLNIEVSLMWRS